jgi:hypothetical protein
MVPGRRFIHAAAVIATLSLAALSLSGCSWTSKDGTRHTVIIGFGLVETNTAHPGVTVQDTKLVGFTAGTEGISLGLVQRHQVEIDPRKVSDIVLSVKSSLWWTTVFALPLADDKSSVDIDNESGDRE